MSSQHQWSNKANVSSIIMDLGNVFDKDLKFRMQIVMKINGVLGAVKCTVYLCLQGCQHNNIVICYNYSHVPNFGLCINYLEPSSYQKLEAIQRRVTKPII